MCVFLIFQRTQASTPPDNITAQPDYVESDFTLEQKSYDIYPNSARVVYTNYACPYCAEFYYNTRDMDYTVRLLILDKDSNRFANQRTVSSFMLSLYHTNSESFEEMQDYLFANQDEWTPLSDEDVLNLLNEKANTTFTFNELEPALKECERMESDAPNDLQFVPALYESNKRYDGLVLKLTGE